MLHLERLIGELPSFVDGTVALHSQFGQVTRLNVHTLHHSVELGAFVTELLAVSIGKSTLTEPPKVLHRDGADVLEELNDHFLGHFPNSYLQVHVLPPRRAVHQLLHGVGRLLLVDEVGRVVHVPELDQTPVHELLQVPNVARVLTEDQGTGLVIVEGALLGDLDLLQELLPLRFEELEKLDLHGLRVRFGHELARSCGFLVALIVHSAGHH